MDDLPSTFDLIVVGTGFIESLVASAASRNGKTVLHLDPNEFYGGSWASFNLEQIAKLANPQPNFDCRLVCTNNKPEWFDFETNGAVHGYDKAGVLSHFRRFNIDLAPTVLFSSGSLVELLISSNISRYAEFRAVDRIAAHVDGKIITVPCSRADVFNNRDLSVVEKRILMKFMQTCLGTDESATRPESRNFETFKEFLQSEKLTPKLVHFVLHSIAMGDERTSCAEGVASVGKFLKSLGRYGNTSFLFPMYGCGELPQCFCRLCAVFGGIYCLNQKIDRILWSDEPKPTVTGVQWGDQTTSAKHVVFGPHCTVEGADLFETSAEEGPKVESTCGDLSRAVVITATPLGGAGQNTGGGGVMFMKLPPLPGRNHKGAHVIQLSHFSGACPKGLYLIHFTCEAIETPEKDLRPYMDLILKTTPPVVTDSPEQPTEETIPTILWSFFFKLPKCSNCNRPNGTTLKAGLKLCCGPRFELDYDLAIAQAKVIFDSMYEGEEFLPRAPDPDEIIFGDEAESDDKGPVNLEAAAGQTDAAAFAIDADAMEPSGDGAETA